MGFVRSGRTGHPAHADVWLLPPFGRVVTALAIAALAVGFCSASSHRRSAAAEPVASVAGAASSARQPADVEDRPHPVVILPLTTSAPAPTPTAAPTTPGAASALTASGLPITALSAYEQAAATRNQLTPGCAIPWPLLAAIGRVESNHGRYGGAVLYSDGTSLPKIIGIPLDGTRSALIRDTDHGVLDGDTVYDRAVGPMQFIPSTWAIYAQDGNGDGRADPFNIFDAAAAAARYLCAAGKQLDTSAGQIAAVLSYNHSTDYLNEVLALEAAYASGAGVRIPPVGPAPAVIPTPTLPPVNAGPPMGSSPTTDPDTGAPAPPAASTAPSAGTTTASTSPPCPAPTTTESSAAPTSEPPTTASATVDPSVTPTTSPATPSVTPSVC